MPQSDAPKFSGTWKALFKVGGCLIPADAFYEWKRIGKSKQPYCFEVNEGDLFTFAGIRDLWKNARGSGSLIDSDHGAECRDRWCPRPYASHP